MQDNQQARAQQAYPINYRYANNQGSSLLAVNNFGHPNRKHFPQYPTEIQRQQSLEFPSERGPSQNFEQPYYPRNLNVRDIEGASPGTLPSPIIRNKENARKAIERDEQERRAQLGEQGRLYQEYVDSIDKFRHDFNAGNGGEFKDRHQLQNQDNPYAPIDNPKYAGDNGVNKPASLLKPFKVPVEGLSNEREDQENQRQQQDTQQQPLTDRRNNDQIKVATSNNFQPKDRQATASLGNLDSFRANQYTSNNNNVVPQPNQSSMIKNNYNSIDSNGNNQNNPIYQPSYGTRLNPTSLSFAGEIPRNANGNSILAARHSIIGNQSQNILPPQPQPSSMVNGTDPYRNTKTMLNLQKFDKYPGEFHGLGAGQFQGNSNAPNQGNVETNIFARQFQRAHAPEDQVGMALKNPVHSYQQGERNLDHYKRDPKGMNPQPQQRDVPYKAYSWHQRQGDNLPLGAPFSYNPGLGKNKSTVMLNHQKQLEKLENSFEIADKTYDNKLKTSPNISTNKSAVKEQEQQQQQFQETQSGLLRQQQQQQAQKQQQYQEQSKEQAQQQQSQQQYPIEQQQQQQGYQKESPFIPRNGYQPQQQQQNPPNQQPSYQPYRQNDGLVYSQQQYQQQQLQQQLDVYQKLQQQRKNQGRGGEGKDGLPEYPQELPTAGLVNRYDEGKKGGRQLMSSLGGVPSMESQLPILGSKALKNISSFRIC